MSTETRRVQFDFIGRDRVSQTMRGIADESEKLEGQMAATGAAAAALAGPAAAAGAAFVGFAAVAAPSIGKVISAQEDLAKNWSGLSDLQRVSALETKNLTDEFEDLADAYQPQALQAYNQVLSTAHNLMPQFTKVVDAGAVGVNTLVGRIAAFAEGPEVASFLQFAAETGPAAMDQFGQAAVTTGSMALTLIQDMAPLGMTLLEVANGTLSALNAVAQLNPALAQLVVTTVLLRGPMTAVVGGISGMATRMRAAAGEGENLGRRQRALNLLTAAGPSLYVAAGVAVGFLALKWLAAKASGDKLIDTLTREYKATGNNLAGHRALVTQLEQTARTLENDLVKAQNNLAASTRTADDASLAQTRVVGDLRKRLDEAREALESKRLTMERVTAAADILRGKYGLTEQEALDLATAAGVDLTKALSDSGGLTEQAAAKIDKYRLSVEAAKDPTKQVDLAMEQLGNSALTLDDRVKGAQAALDAYFNPSLAAFNATTQLKAGVDQLAEAFRKAKGNADGNTESSRQLRSAYASVLQSTTELWQATIRKDGDDAKANATLKAQIPILYAMARGDENLTAQVDALSMSVNKMTGRTNISRESFIKAAESMGIARTHAEKLWKEYAKVPKQTSNAAGGVESFSKRTLQALKEINPKNVDVTVYANGKFRRATTAGLARGGPVPAHLALGPGGPTSDDVPIWASVGEFMLSAQDVKNLGGVEGVERMRALARRGLMQKFAAGGSVRFRARVPSGRRIGQVADYAEEAHRKLIDGRAAHEEAELLAALWKKYAGSGGPVVAAARRWIGTPYSWGGGGPAGPSYGIGRGAGTYGFDCSGLTEHAWWQGARVRIGGTTYSQHPNSYGIGSPRPGALGFSTGLGHVVLASDKPGYVIEAPYTGSYVREVRKSMPDWRWPRGASSTAGLADGGPVERLGQAVVDGRALRRDLRMAKLAGIASDPGRRRAMGGPVTGGLPYLVGEDAPEVFVPRTGGRVHRAGSTVVVQHINPTINVPTAYHKGQVAAEIRELLKYDAKNGGKNPYDRRG